MSALREGIEGWRYSRTKRSPMPRELWAEATALAAGGETYSVARALGLNFESLKRRVAEATVGAGDVEVREGGEFVELTGAQLLGGGSGAGAVVEVVDLEGRRLTIRLPGSTVLDVAAVVDAFRGLCG
jgi:hypothetical protein